MNISPKLRFKSLDHDRVGFDFDERGGVDEARNLDHRGGGADVGEDLAVNLANKQYQLKSQVRARYVRSPH